MQPSQLYPHEWFIAFLFIGVLTALSAYSWLHSTTELAPQLGEEVWQKASLVSVSIQGAVEKPGDYQIKRGTTLKAAVLMAQPRRDADLSKLDSSFKITRKKKIKVPVKKY